ERAGAEHREPLGELLLPAGSCSRRRRRRLGGAPGSDARRGRGVGQWQEHDRPGGDRTLSARRQGGRHRAPPWRGPRRDVRGGAAARAGAARRVRLPGPDDLAEPGDARRPAGDRGLGGAPGPSRRRRAQPGSRAPRHGGDPVSGAARRQLPAPVLRRHAPACRHRDGSCQRPRAAHRRRGDHGAGRHHAGADPGARRVAPGAARHRGRLDHPRPRRRRRDRRPGRRHVRRPHPRARHGRPHLRLPRASLHAGAAGRPAAARRTGGPPGHHPRGATGAASAATGLRLLSEVPGARGRALPDRGAAADGDRSGAPCPHLLPSAPLRHRTAGLM
ncbi:MAG: Oligopeptide transport ATP-binding protein OppD, partial [uncultured Nocardioidaceae bacterium]